MSRKVKYLRLHTKLFIPGLGDIGDVLPAPQKNYKLDMSDSEQGVLVNVSNDKSAKFECRIPDGNIALIVYAAAEEPKVIVKK